MLSSRITYSDAAPSLGYCRVNIFFAYLRWSSVRSMWLGSSRPRVLRGTTWPTSGNASAREEGAGIVANRDVLRECHIGLLA